jgi:glucose-6-phosphate isomerase/transaldolase/glucose-6-phosphate isomerase
MSLVQQLAADRVASRIWQRDAGVFVRSGPGAAAAHEVIRNRLGWLDAPVTMESDRAPLRAFAEEARRDGITAVYLLGMGGSSLCAEVMRETRPAGTRGAALTVLDTTDERTIDLASGTLDPVRTLFLVSSKSGSTIEVTSLERHFGSLATRALGDAAGQQFVAITDPGTALQRLAAEHRYRHCFMNPADIGGRYSALSLFGLVPAVLIGLDPETVLASSRKMADRCRSDAADNPGLALGAYIAEQAGDGRDKLTLLLPPSLAPLGLWIEQLIAESTGKVGRGVLPVVDEPSGSPEDYGGDRAFVTYGGDDSAAVESCAAALEAAGHPVFRIDRASEGLGAEFFRWEFATAVAGAALGINAFDEPNVKEAKARTQSLLDAYHSAGALRVDPPLKPFERMMGCLIREHRPKNPSSASSRYVALLDYLPSDAARVETIARVRARIRSVTHAATTHGFGPRYLHSTGQYHKGGPNTGIFVLLTAADEITTPVPGTDYSFSVLKQAQALGDFEALVAADRRVVHLHFDTPGADFSSLMERALWDLPLFD